MSAQIHATATLPPPKKKISFKRIGEPVIEEAPKKVGAPPKKTITELEKTLIEKNGGEFQTLEVPEKPLPTQELFEFQAQQMTQVENLMYQGLRSPHLIAQAAKMSEHLAERYIKAVLARWQTLGSEVDLKTQRGEALGYLDFLQNQLWTQFSAAKNILDAENRKPVAERDLRAMGSARAQMMNLNPQILALNTQRNQLYGLTPQAIQQMLIMGGNDEHEVLIRMRKQHAVKDFAAKFGAYILQRQQQEKANAIDV